MLLCSDGLYNRIPGEEMLAVLQENIERPQQGLEQLFGLALKREEPDNITAVLMYTGEDKGPSAAAAGLRGRSKWAGILVVALVAVVLGFWFLLPKQGGEADLVAQTTTATDTEAEAAAGSAAQDTAAPAVAAAAEEATATPEPEQIAEQAESPVATVTEEEPAAIETTDATVEAEGGNSITNTIDSTAAIDGAAAIGSALDGDEMPPQTTTW